eukprot:2071066-Amphidinium_carterae.1
MMTSSSCNFQSGKGFCSGDGPPRRPRYRSLAASQSVMAAQDMWQLELLQVEADRSALLCKSARDILRPEGAKAIPNLKVAQTSQ